VLAAEQRIDDLLRPCRVAVRLMRVVRMHGVPAAWLLVNVRVDDLAVVVNDRRVADDFVIHGWLGLWLVKDVRWRAAPLGGFTFSRRGCTSGFLRCQLLIWQCLA
jgi:hypothetical protein